MNGISRSYNGHTYFEFDKGAYLTLLCPCSEAMKHQGIIRALSVVPGRSRAGDDAVVRLLPALLSLISVAVVRIIVVVPIIVVPTYGAAANG